MSNTLIPAQHNNVEQLHQLGKMIPGSGFDGLNELYLLLNELVSETEAENIQNPALGKLFATAQQHISNAPDSTTIQLLIEHFRQFAADLDLSEEDFSFIEAMLQQDQSETTAQPDTPEFDQSLWLDQIGLFSEHAEQAELSALQDILFLLQDWYETHSTSAAQFADQLTQILDGINIYISATNNHHAAIEQIFNALLSLDNTLPLEQEDIDDLEQLLTEEAEQQIAQEEVNNSTAATPAENYLSELADQLSQQLKQHLNSAEQLELNGIQDIIYLIDELLQQNELNEAKLSSYQNLSQQIAAYLAGPSTDETIDKLLQNLNQIQDTPLIDAEDISLLKQLLSQEAQQAFNDKQEEEFTNSDKNANIEQSSDTAANNDIEIPEHIQEFCTLLQITFQPIQALLHEVISTDVIDKPALWEDLNEHLSKFSTIALTAEFNGLHQSSVHVIQNIPALTAQDKPEIQDLFKRWSDCISLYLSSPLTQETIHTLLALHCDPQWAAPISESKATELLTALQALEGDNQDTLPEPRQQKAQAEDVSLSLPDDIDAELVNSLLDELPEQTKTFSSAIEHLNQGGSLQDVITAQRVAHTLKGAGNTVGVNGIANLTHHLEDILTALANEQRLPDNNIMATLQRATDCLEEMTEALTLNAAEPEDALTTLQEVLDLARLIDEHGISHIIKARSNETESIASVQPEASKVTENEETSEQMIRLPVSVVDKLLQFSDEIMINNGQLREQIKQAVQQSKTLQAHLEQFHYLGEEMLDLVDLQRTQQIQNHALGSNEHEFDTLEMDQYNDLYSSSRRLHEMTSDSREMNRIFSSQLRDIDTLLIEQGYLNNAAQENLLDMRTIPVQTITSRLQRSVRQASRMINKDVNFEISGDDILVDRDILNGVMDPLMHLLRNAVDHGIETEDRRLESGKKAQGQIKLHFQRSKNMIAIDCIDDGAGLNLPAIKAKAIKKGLINEDALLSDDEIKQLIMQPNFSTQEQVSQISGRGVGMDAVNTGIRSLGGTFHLETETGKGCHFHIQLPLSLAHYNTLLVKIGEQTIAVAELGIEQALLPDSGVLSEQDGEYWFEFDHKKYAVRTIESMLSRVQPNEQIAIQSRTLLLINQQENYYAIAVESVLKVKEMVVKGMDDILTKVHGVIGASLLDDGSIAPVIDLQELLQQPSRWGAEDSEQLSNNQPADLPYALVVDDSLSARRSLEQFFSDMGFRIIAARDGLEAIEQMEQKIPDIVITDLEMPRVNGLELTEHVRREPALKDLPVIMITSRATSKHKQLAEEKGVSAYLTKPYPEDILTRTVLDLIDNKPKNNS